MVNLFKALSEEIRLRILALLMDGEMCVCEIESCLNLSQSNASRHLTVLKNAGVLESYKKAQWVYYRISERFIDENTVLYEYLKSKVSELPAYEKDRIEAIKCKKLDICSCKGDKEYAK